MAYNRTNHKDKTQLERTGRNTRAAGEHNQTITQAGKHKDRTNGENAFENKTEKNN